MPPDERKLLGRQRRQKILDLIQEEGAARVSELSKSFQVSEPTIRQDLEKLETEGLVLRQRGGAFLKSLPRQVQELALHHLDNMDKKSAIGRVAASLVNDDESIILDAGSTTTEVARNLLGRRGLKVITNALNITLILGAEPTNQVHMTGGEFKAPTLSVTGEKAAAFFGNLRAQKLFLAVGGVSLDAGLTYPGFADLYVKKAMINAAAETYLVADSTKMGLISFALLGGVELVHTLVTDSGLRDEDRRAFEARGVRVLVAEVDPAHSE